MEYKNSTSHHQRKAGLAGVITVSYAFVSPLINLIAGFLTFQGLSVCAGFLSDESTEHFFQETATALGMLAGVVGTVSVIAVLGIMIVMGI